MPKTAHIYVPSPSRENLEIGLDQGLWGWRRSALDRAGTRQAVQSLTEGDFLVLGHRGPNSRVAPGGWANATLQRVIVTQVSRPYFTDSTPVWPGDDYPERIGIDVLEEEQNVPGTALGTDAMEALRLSANKQGAAVLQPGIAAVAQLADVLPLVPVLPGDATVDHEGTDSAVAQVLVRREQVKLRKNLLGGATEAACALCGRVLPTRFIRAAHIKRRSAASRQERLMMANIMPACLIGCDELFEHGYLYVTDNGTIAVSPKSNATPDLAVAAKALEGRTVADYGPHRAPFYIWHRTHIAN
ncbi:MULTISPECIES: hypothetical protein [Streptomyces]|uniref:HNH endonuclease n=1 Tax=Streptomyces coelicolor (strain ATCC BAA-471 / A3(2) / M145) TaxID=100226 RepID=Q9XAH0_STRCO|nr:MULTISPECIES: hypothetical protein [Streptomyces]MDX2927675.1 hypothetical protein [Streptomyces sp. NRRL_B-16638]MYU44852.1 hypothetical protein [Streptomyces sp. SID7813]NSL84321.1 hypothetical protein [Streptomyces coelicolor]QFI45213.1 hypothetical protein FQ762_27535 [Streptomyces coelicolor A3(2)]QKN68807.1 hypothetical protein HCU77_27000 [Streptomyces coelicolor]